MMGALRSMRRKHRHRTQAARAPLAPYPPRRAFVCDCGEHLASADELSIHAEGCEMVPAGEYPKGEARIIRFEAIAQRVRTPFPTFILMLALSEASFVTGEMDDEELGNYFRIVYGWYGAQPEDFV